MGQISLPRLEKINTSMSWESSLYYNTEQWASPKLFILHKLFARCLFKNFFSYKRSHWLNCRLSKKPIWFKHSRMILYSRFKENIQNTSSKFRILNTYIYYYDNKYSTIVIYSTKTIKSNSRKKKCKPFSF